MAPLTENQITNRRIIKSVYFPVHLADELDQATERYGISWNKLIRGLVTVGLHDKEILETAVQGKVESHTPVPTPEVEPTPEPVEGDDLIG
jgi:hypothetical protein